MVSLRAVCRWVWRSDVAASFQLAGSSRQVENLPPQTNANRSRTSNLPGGEVSRQLRGTCLLQSERATGPADPARSVGFLLLCLADPDDASATRERQPSSGWI